MSKASKIGYKVDVRKTRADIEKEKKLNRIIQRVMSEMTDEEKEQLLQQDGKFRNLTIDHKKALEKGKAFSATIIERQIKARISEILMEKSAEIIYRLISNGEIMRYLDDEDQRTMLAYRIRTMMLLDAVDSSFKDMSATLHSVGIDGDLIVSEEIQKARESIDRYIKFNTNGVDEELRTLMLEDADRVYDFAGKRVPVLNRKVERIGARKAKEVVQ